MTLTKRLGAVVVTGALAFGLVACSGGNADKNKQEADGGGSSQQEVSVQEEMPVQEETQEETTSEIDAEKEIIGVWELEGESGQIAFTGDVMLMDTAEQGMPVMPYTMTVEDNKATLNVADYNMTIDVEFASADTATITLTSGNNSTESEEAKKIDSNPDKTTLGSVVHLSLGELYEDDTMSIQIDSLDFLDDVNYDVYHINPSDGAKLMSVQGKLKNMPNAEWDLGGGSLLGTIVVNNKYALSTRYLCSGLAGFHVAPMNSVDFTSCTDISPDEIDNIESATLYLCFANLYTGGKTFVVNLVQVFIGKLKAQLAQRADTYKVSVRFVL